MRPLLLTAVSALLLVACSQTNVAKDPATDPSCVSYFDGCNACRKMDGAAACTKKYCAPDLMQEPKCLEYVD